MEKILKNQHRVHVLLNAYHNLLVKQNFFIGIDEAIINENEPPELELFLAESKRLNTKIMKLLN